MKKSHSLPNRWTCVPVALATLAATLGLQAATPLNGRLDLRPLSPSDIADYQLGAAQKSGGLSTVAIGEPVYLDAEVNIAIPASDIVSVTWSLTAKPLGSTAALTDSPLGANVPIYKPSDQLVYQLAGRQMLRPDVRGEYTISLTIVTASEGTTNLTQNITAGVWMGVQTCELCHSGSLVAPNKYVPWSHTLHASKFTRGIDGEIPGYGKNCISCHTVGYDTNPYATNGGFDDIAAQLGWTFPTNLVESNWTNMQAQYPSLANLANIQCENCHGPGSEHAASFGDTNLISVNLNEGNCGQCHDAKPHHVNVPEWNNSVHAVTTTDPSGPGHELCVGCHTGIGFEQRMKSVAAGGAAYQTNTTYEAITCAACHDPHDATNPHQLRNVGPVTLMDGTVVTNAGMGELCMNCHHSRQTAATYATSYHPYFGPHHGPQGDMLEGVNGFTYGQDIPSSAHRNAVTNTCVTCHMQTVASSDPAFLKAGGHTFRPAWDGDTNHPDGEDLVGACQQCHGPAVTDFDFPLQDYDGDGVIEGVQTEVQHLLDKVALLLPPAGQPKTSVTPDSTWTAPQLEAYYDYDFVKEDGSMGIHNTAYAVGLLKASIANLTGDANNDGIPDSWQIQYFGSITNPNAAPSADPTGDGVPNWLKYALGVDPTVAGQVLTNGVVFGNVTAIGGQTNSVHIYTAAEVAFDTELGKTYQIQAISVLSGGQWTDVGQPIQGTGKSISYLTPMRDTVQQYFRVVHN